MRPRIVYSGVHLYSLGKKTFTRNKEALFSSVLKMSLNDVTKHFPTAEVMHVSLSLTVAEWYSSYLRNCLFQGLNLNLAPKSLALENRVKDFFIHFLFYLFLDFYHGTVLANQ